MSKKTRLFCCGQEVSLVLYPSNYPNDYVGRCIKWLWLALRRGSVTIGQDLTEVMVCCGLLTTMLGTKLCINCWELESRLAIYVKSWRGLINLQLAFWQGIWRKIKRFLEDRRF